MMTSEMQEVVFGALVLHNLGVCIVHQVTLTSKKAVLANASRADVVMCHIQAWLGKVSEQIEHL